MKTEQSARPPDVNRRDLLLYARPPGWVNPVPAAPYDLIVLGAGPAGLTAASMAAQRGAKVALVERNLLGGVSLQTGSVPSKALISAAHFYTTMQNAEKMGAVLPDVIQKGFGGAMERMRRLRTRLAQYQSAERLTLAGIDLYFGAARFTGRDALMVDATPLRFAKMLIATGARPKPNVIPGIEEAGYCTTENIFDLEERPRRLLVIGGGPTGCELAQTFCRLGSHVVIAQDEPKFLPREERDAAQILSESLARDGVEIHLNTRVVAVRAGAGGEKLADLLADEQLNTLTVDHILAGVGRTPNVEDLGLGTAGIDCDGQGIRVDDFQCTANPLVYAAGDVCLEHRFAHVAEASARVAVANALFGGQERMSALTIPWCTYTDPEIAHVGLYVSEARDRSIPVRTFTVMMQDTDRAMLDGQEQGFVKVHVRDGSDEVIGATIVAAHAGEMINEITLAIDARIGLSTLAKIIHAYPTQASAIKMAADAYVRWKTRLTHDIARPPWPTE